MPGEFYFMAVGGLGVTLAGFAGLIAALQDRRDEGHSPAAAWRVRNVVFQGFSVTFVGFATVALYTITEDITLTVRLATIFLLLARAAIWSEFRPSAAWRTERQRWATIFLNVVFAAAVLANVAVASVGYLQLLLLFTLSVPAGIFARAVREVTQGDGSRQ